MAETEERPKKIRKLSQPEGTDELEPTSNSTEEVTTTENDSKDTTSFLEETPIQDVEPATEENEGEGKETPKMSKSQLKKIRKKEQWEAGKDYRRAKRKVKAKEKKARMAAERVSDNASAEKAPPTRKIPPTKVPVTLILDCDFDELMHEKEISSLAQQLTRCYSDNRSAVYKTQLVISSFKKGGMLRERFEKGLFGTHEGWSGVVFTEEAFVEAAREAQGVMEGGRHGEVAGAMLGKDAVDQGGEAGGDEVAELVKAGDGQDTEVSISAAPGTAPKESAPSGESDPNPQSQTPPTQQPSPSTPPKIIYLTSDSPHTLTSLTPNTSYIIGGIVDKNRHKGLCYKRACDLGIETAKLPIGEYMTMQSRTVLTTNHVVEIMLRWLEDGDWGKAFLRVIPERKGARLRKQQEEGDVEDVNGEDGVDGGKEVNGDEDVNGDEILKGREALNGEEGLSGEVYANEEEASSTKGAES